MKHHPAYSAAGAPPRMLDDGWGTEDAYEYAEAVKPTPLDDGAPPPRAPPRTGTRGPPFWARDPCVLLSPFELVPGVDATRNAKLNALTRLILIATAVLAYLKYQHWLSFLALALLAVVLLKHAPGPGTCKDDTVQEAPSPGVREGFTVTPTYNAPDFMQTTVAPTFAEEWQIPPPSYDIYSSTPAQSTFFDPPDPRSYPYGQYLTKTNQLPSDEYYTHTKTGGLREAREYQNSAFLRHDLAFRDNMMRIRKLSLERRFRHNCNDIFSPYYSF